MKIYLASPLFNEEEITNIKKALSILRSRGYTVYSSTENDYSAYTKDTREWSEAVFNNDSNGVKNADIIVCLYYGAFSDSGSAWEVGYANGLGKKTVLVQLGKDSNLMLHESAVASISFDELNTYDFNNLPNRKYEGRMF